ncbi:conserved hypothetical protein [Corynebacterium efficiens YS-314]|uniref:Uncharacterized protein n=1 Tax=Corynebacterium efficiens (strain DSM 44549 / YS-314 / AJ 12310 / JCM 11189 / NBRC 100395) TaxID=196164 RepID=Q8FSL8_COREF|nr:conserved hypothetical protein [Corynebacterium efficiens YS-314]
MCCSRHLYFYLRYHWIRMGYHDPRNPGTPKPHLAHQQCVLDQAGPHVIGDRKAHQPAGIAVDDGGQVHIRPIRDRQVSDVPDVHLIRLVGGEFPAHQVREHWFLLIGDCGGDLAFLCIAE